MFISFQFVRKHKHILKQEIKINMTNLNNKDLTDKLVELKHNMSELLRKKNKLLKKNIKIKYFTEIRYGEMMNEMERTITNLDEVTSDLKKIREKFRIREYEIHKKKKNIIPDRFQIKDIKEQINMNDECNEDQNKINMEIQHDFSIQSNTKQKKTKMNVLSENVKNQKKSKN